MVNHILADYYEHNLLIKKAQRLRRKSSKVIWGYYKQYNLLLGITLNYGYKYRGDGWGDGGIGYGYRLGNGWSYYK